MIVKKLALDVVTQPQSSAVALILFEMRNIEYETSGQRAIKSCEELTVDCSMLVECEMI